MTHKGRLGKKMAEQASQQAATIPKDKRVHINARKGVACPLCHANMVYTGREVPGLSRDKRKNLIPVKRRIWLCSNSNCMNVISFEYRLDGKQGDLNRKLKEEEHGLRKKRVTIIEGTND